MSGSKAAQARRRRREHDGAREQEDWELGSHEVNLSVKIFVGDWGGEYIGMTNDYVPSDLTLQIHCHSGFNGKDFTTIAAKILGQTIAGISAFQIRKRFAKPNSLSATENLDKKLTAFVSELNDVRNKIHIGSNLHDEWI